MRCRRFPGGAATAGLMLGFPFACARSGGTDIAFVSQSFDSGMHMQMRGGMMRNYLVEG